MAEQTVTYPQVALALKLYGAGEDWREEFMLLLGTVVNLEEGWDLKRGTDLDQEDVGSEVRDSDGDSEILNDVQKKDDRWSAHEGLWTVVGTSLVYFKRDKFVSIKKAE